MARLAGVEVRVIARTTLFCGCVLAICAPSACSETASPLPAPPTPPELVDAYIGYASMADFDIDDEVWIRRGALQIHGDQITLSTSALVCKMGKVFSSEFDGGFYVYKGRISGESGHQVASLHLTDCDYCKKPPHDDTRSLAFRVIDANAVELDGIKMDRLSPALPATCPEIPASSTLPPEGNASDTEDQSR